MQNTPTSTPRKNLTPAQGEEAVILYETGVMNGAVIARHFGVERNVVYRHLKAAGAVNGRLVHKHIDKLNAEIDARRLAQSIEMNADNDRRLDGFIRSAEDLHKFMKALVQADRDGTLAAFVCPKLAR